MVPGSPSPSDLPALLAALLVFAIGLAFAAFLWWLAAHSFALLRDPRTTPEQLASLRDLPLALPEGTVRALLALIVGVVGLPLLLFSQALRLPDAIAGYVNGIIAGVFGYYFGARGGSGDAATARRAAEALASQTQAHAELRAQHQALTGAVQQGQVAQALAAVSRQIGIAEQVVEVLGPALPAGMLPAGAAAALAKAREAAAAAGRLADGQADAGTLAALQSALGGLTGRDGPFPALLRAAGAALPALGGPLGAAALLLGLGWQAGSAAWQRWRAAILDAPHDPALFDPGSITPSSAALRLHQAPIFARVFADQAAEPGFIASLLDLVLREDAAARLWAAHGARFTSPAEAEQGLAEYRRALLAERLAADVTEPAVQQVALTLAQAASPLRASADAAAVRAALAAAGTSRAPAIQALGLLTGALREARLDPLPALQELTP